MAVSIRQYKADTHTFDAAVLSDSVVAVVGARRDNGAVPVLSGFTDLGQPLEYTGNDGEQGRVFIQARLASSTSAGSWDPTGAWADGGTYKWGLYEIAGASMDGTTVLNTAEGTAPLTSSADLDLGDFTDASGVVLMTEAIGKATGHGACQGPATTMGAGWTERFEAALTGGGPKVAVGDAAPSATLAASWSWACTTSGEIGTWAGLAVLFSEAAPEPTAGVFIDWDDNGFALATNDDISAAGNVVHWVINRGASAEITGGANPGTCTLTLKNPDDIYNPRNASSPLYGLLLDGKPIWIGVNSDGVLTGDDPRGLFGGRIKDITLLPAGGADESPLVEITCEDALGWYDRTPVLVDYAEGRAHDALRQDALDAALETRYSLAHEIHTMPLSHAEGSLLSVLERINAVNGTRHFAKPEDLYTDWYTYTTRNRQWRLDATVDASVDAGAEHVTDTSGWRQSAETVINQQKATVTPIVFTPGTFTVWEADKLPIGVTATKPYSRIVDFDDVVRDQVLDIANTGGALTSTLTPFASSAKIELSASGARTVTRLSVEGRLARRLPDEGYVADDETSQAAPRGIRAGSTIGNEYLGVIASARGIAEHVVWRYGDPQFRPTLTIHNWFPEQFELDLYDTISFTSAQLGITDRLFEIVGLTHESDVAAATVQHHTVTYVLQECKVQSDPGWFYLDDDPGSLLDDTAVLAY